MINDRRNSLVAKLSHKEAISPSDANWLDQEGNTVNKWHILDTLQSTSDYERAVEILDENGKAIVQKLSVMSLWGCGLCSVCESEFL